MVDFVQKQVLDADSFSNDNTNGTSAIKVRVDAGSVVGDAIINAAGGVSANAVTPAQLAASQATQDAAIASAQATATQALNTDASATTAGRVNLSPLQVLGAGDKIINGVRVGRGGGGVASNTASGLSALQNNTTGTFNTASGVNALQLNTTGAQNTASGVNALQNNTTGGSNTASGVRALQFNTTGVNNTASGAGALQNNTTGGLNTASGVSALQNNTIGGGNTASGVSALYNNTTGGSNTASGVSALFSNTTGGNNTASGVNALYNNTIGNYNTASGGSALFSNTIGGGNTASGLNALYSNATGGDNTASGAYALYSNTIGIRNTAVGAYALGTSTAYDNASAIGYLADVTGSDQVQLGNSATTTYAYGAVQNRSDRRDKADIKDTALGLAFINELRPVSAKWDYREDYRAPAPAPFNEQFELAQPAEDASADEKAAYKTARGKYDKAADDYQKEVLKWREENRLANIKADGSKMRKRDHQMLIAQEVQAVCKKMGVDFGGLQDHSINGGEDVMSLGYEEFIPVLIKAVQELAAEVAALKAAKP